MSKINKAVYPGSFNPFHKGHKCVIEHLAYSDIFDQIHIAIGINPDKDNNDLSKRIEQVKQSVKKFGSFVCIDTYTGLLKDYIKENHDIRAVIKGIRDTNDFLYEQKMQYHNEDLGIIIPTFYIITNRDLVHISSSAIRSIEKFKKGNK